MIELKKYQEKAVKELVEKINFLMQLPGSRKKLIFKSPTGSGKTVMAAEMMAKLSNEFADSSDSLSNAPAYIWIAPNKLHEQSYAKIKARFNETRELQPIEYDEMDHSLYGYIRSGEILFVNWESINKENAIMVRETENSSSLFDISRRTREEQGTPIIVIIDEEHLFAGKIANKSEEVLKKIDPKLEVRISATPITNDYDAETVTVHREEVIAEEMIKEHIVLNENLNFDTNSRSTTSLHQHLLNIALRKREEIANALKSLNVDINPLLLIQLPNDNSETLTQEEATIRDEMIEYLKTAKDITTDNGKLAIWLSGEKENRQGIEKNDSMVEALLFKQAIAMGWDCPRAAVLLIFRKIESFTFSAQTVGRILRMPEQHFYEIGLLNIGYVYTNLSKKMIEIVRDDMDYISSINATQRPGLNNITLHSEYFERLASDRNRLGPDFKEYLLECFEEKWHVKKVNIPTDKSSDNGEWLLFQISNRDCIKKFITLDAEDLNEEIVKDQNITGELGKTLLENHSTYYLNTAELKTEFKTFCKKMLGSMFEKISVSTLDFRLRELMNELFGIEDEAKAINIILHSANRPKFEDILNYTLETYLEKLKKQQEEKKDKSLVSYNWEVPKSRSYADETNHVREDVKNHALLPFVELNAVHNPEKEFTAFLEENSRYIDWWYKNGDAGRQHFAISYINKKEGRALFYVDFIIRMKNGHIFLFDTKTPESDQNAPAKHNALIDYINDPNKNNGLHISGGIIIKSGSNWKYSTKKIDNTSDITNWDSFYPQNYETY